MSDIVQWAFDKSNSVADILYHIKMMGFDEKDMIGRILFRGDKLILIVDDTCEFGKSGECRPNKTEPTREAVALLKELMCVTGVQKHISVDLASRLEKFLEQPHQESVEESDSDIAMIKKLANENVKLVAELNRLEQSNKGG